MPDAGMAAGEGQPGPEAEGKPFADELRARVGREHRQSDRTINLQAPLVLADRRSWRRLVQDFSLIYSAIEAGIQGNKEHPVLAPLFELHVRIARTEVMRADLAWYEAHWGPETRPTTTVIERQQDPGLAISAYCQRIKAVSEEEPELLVAYAQAMYFALLAGGQVIKGLARRTLSLPRDGPGTAFFDFPELGDVGAFKADYKAALNALPLDRHTKERIIKEKQGVFARNNAVVLEAAQDIRARTKVGALALLLLALLLFLLLLYRLVL